MPPRYHRRFGSPAFGSVLGIIWLLIVVRS